MSLSNDCGTPQPLRWLVSDRIPLGRITLLVGSADSGKTSVAMDLSSRIASGEFWPEITEMESEEEEVAEEYPGDPNLVKTYTSPSGSYNVYTTRPVQPAPPENTDGTPSASETNTVNANDDAQQERKTRECHLNEPGASGVLERTARIQANPNRPGWRGMIAKILPPCKIADHGNADLPYRW